MRSQVCVDANLVVALLTLEHFSQPSWSLWQDWVENDFRIVAPRLMRYDVTSAIYRKELRNKISAEDAHRAIQEFIKIEFEFLDPPDLPERAYQLAKRFQRSNSYDAHYLALAEYLGCEFWTADERLYNASKDGFPNIHWVGNL